MYNYDSIIVIAKKAQNTFLQMNYKNKGMYKETPWGLFIRR